MESRVYKEVGSIDKNQRRIRCKSRDDGVEGMVRHCRDDYLYRWQELSYRKRRSGAMWMLPVG
jgi:hypothetical protein